MRITLMNNRAEYIINELGDKCREIDRDLDFVRIEILELNSQTLLSLFHAGHNAGFDACINEIEKKFKKLGFFN